MPRRGGRRRRNARGLQKGFRTVKRKRKRKKSYLRSESRIVCIIRLWGLRRSKPRKRSAEGVLDTVVGVPSTPSTDKRAVAAMMVSISRGEEVG